MVLTQKELHDALSGRHGAAVQAQLDRAAVGIAGLGGLGSHIAAVSYTHLALARAGCYSGAEPGKAAGLLPAGRGRNGGRRKWIT